MQRESQLKRAPVTAQARDSVMPAARRGRAEPGWAADRGWGGARWSEVKRDRDGGDMVLPQTRVSGRDVTTDVYVED